MAHSLRFRILCLSLFVFFFRLSFKPKLHVSPLFSLNALYKVHAVVPPNSKPDVLHYLLYVATDKRRQSQILVHLNVSPSTVGLPDSRPPPHLSTCGALSPLAARVARKDEALIRIQPSLASASLWSMP